MRKPPLASLPDHSTKNTSCGILLAFILLSGLSFRLACPYFAMHLRFASTIPLIQPDISHMYQQLINYIRKALLIKCANMKIIIDYNNYKI